MFIPIILHIFAAAKADPLKGNDMPYRRKDVLRTKYPD